MEREVKREIVKAGRILFDLGLVGYTSGNISALMGNTIFITRTGSKLGYLSEKDIVSFTLNEKIPETASVESIVHRAIYASTTSTHIIHAHPPHLVALSLIQRKIIPLDAEGKYYLKEIPVYRARNPIGSEEVAEIASSVAKEHKLILIRSHGIFVHGNSWDEVLNIASVAEKSAQIIFLTAQIKNYSLREKK